MFLRSMLLKSKPITLAATMTLLALTVTACGTQTPTATPIALRPTQQIVTKPPQTLERGSPTPLPSDTPPAIGTSAVDASTAIPIDVTSGPTVTSSGPILSPGTSNSAAFNKSSPASSGPFKRITAQNGSYEYGSVLSYRTDDGAVYQVALWITRSAQDAVDRYSLETSTLLSKQPLKVGDEGIITATDPVMAEVHYRNMVLIIYRPEPTGTVPKIKITDSQLIDLVNALFKAIPAS